MDDDDDDVCARRRLCLVSFLFAAFFIAIGMLIEDAIQRRAAYFG